MAVKSTTTLQKRSQPPKSPAPSERILGKIFENQIELMVSSNIPGATR